ncbi:MAG: LysE family translocator, partial [Burkholderiales bacterium]|nr:LysE family translocator [Burkholderiales bacterium]
PQLVLLGSICVALNTLVDVVAALAAHRLLKSSVARTARARVMTRTAGVALICLGVFLATAKRQS